jgi:hypothetical protein
MQNVKALEDYLYKVSTMDEEREQKGNEFNRRRNCTSSEQIIPGSTHASKKPMNFSTLTVTKRAVITSLSKIWNGLLLSFTWK